MFKFKSDAPARTAELARRLAGVLRPGTVICLDGDLGAGKTLFVQNLAASLGVQGEVTSPTFNLMNVYEDGRLPLVHFDLYRLEQEYELDEIGFYDYAEHFPSDSAAKSVPSVPSVACSTAEALAWDASFKNQNDPSGRAVAGVHEQAYK